MSATDPGLEADSTSAAKQVVLTVMRRAEAAGATPVPVHVLRQESGLDPDQLAAGMNALEAEKVVSRLPEGYYFTPPDPDADDEKPAEGSQESAGGDEDGSGVLATLDAATGAHVAGERPFRVTIVTVLDLTTTGTDEELVEAAREVTRNVHEELHESPMLMDSASRLHRVETYEGVRTLFGA